MSEGLSVAHLRPRSSFAFVLTINWLSRALLGWLCALPLITAVGASGLSELPRADRALFEAGGLWLVELGYREANALSAGLRAAAVLALAALILRMPVSALLYVATHEPKASLSLAFRRALGGFSRFLGLWLFELTLRGLLLALTLLLASSVAALKLYAGDEMLAALPPLVAVAFGLALSGLVSVALDGARAHSVLAPKDSFGAALAAGAALVRARAFECSGSYIFYVGAGLLLVALGARAAEALDVSRSGALRVLAVFVAHQAVLLGLCLLQALWVRRVVDLSQPGPASPSALR